MTIYHAIVVIHIISSFLLMCIKSMHINDVIRELTPIKSVEYHVSILLGSLQGQLISYHLETIELEKFVL
jgi:hypothetical protein